MTKDKEVLKLILKNQSLLLQTVAVILVNNVSGNNNGWFQSMKNQAEQTELMIEKLNKR